MKATFIRITLSAVLIYFVYGETGGFTAFALALVMIGAEVTALHLSLLSKLVRHRHRDAGGRQE